VTETLRKTGGIRLSRRLAARLDHGVLAEEEAKWIGRSARSILASPSDAAYLAGRGVPAERLAVVPNGVSREKGRLPRPAAYAAGSPVVAFVGNMGYPPNEEGARWFLGEVWPKVRNEMPGAVFAAAGGNPRASLRRLDNGKDVRVTGYLPSIEPYVVHATMTVAPLRVSAGMQNKVALSMALGVPVVATPGAVSWLPEKARKWVVQALKAEEFARARKAAAFIRVHYRWERAGRLLDSLMKDVVGKVRP
jgi:glycosyltransferase involved in cell wall biosynthesis